MADIFYFYDTIMTLNVFQKRDYISGTDFTVSVGVHICHNIGTHLKTYFMIENRFCSKMCSRGPYFGVLNFTITMAMRS